MDVSSAGPVAPQTPSEIARGKIAAASAAVDASAAKNIAPVNDVAVIVTVAKQASDKDLLDKNAKAAVKAHNKVVGDASICKQVTETLPLVGDAIRALEGVPGLGSDPALAAARAAIDNAAVKRDTTIAAVDKNASDIAALRTIEPPCAPPKPAKPD